MEALGGGSDSRGIPPSSPRGGGGGGSSRSFAVPFSASNLFQAPLSALLEYSGILQPVVRQSEREILIPSQELRPALVNEPVVYAQGGGGGGGGGGGREVSIRIIGTGYQENLRVPATQPQHPVAGPDGQGSSSGSDDGISAELTTSTLDRHGGEDGASSAVHGAATSSSSSSASVDRRSMDGEANVTDGNNRNSSYQRYDIQQIARWIEQILPFSLLLLVVFIRQHLQGFFITIWISIVMFKSNDILRKQTALKACAFATNNQWCIKRNQVNLPYVVLVVTSVLFAFVEFLKSSLAGERVIPVLVGIMLIFMIHIFSIYWWCRNDDLLYPLIMLPPKEIPSFWHAIFIILVNDVMVRQAAMVLKCTLLLYYRNRRGRSYLKQAQMLTLVEYLILLYRSLLPTPVWYRFFLNKEYGSLFSSLTTGLYLTFKLTSVVEKVQSFVSALKALSHKEIHYGSYATNEQVLAAGDLCAICQEKMHVPVLLRCKHIFCEDCVSEWFERERTCPLCRALVKPAGLRSFGDGSTSLFFQMF